MTGLASGGAGITLATYNIHSCVGRDGRYDPDRTLAVLRELDCDVIALQELQWQPEEALDLLYHLAANLALQPIAGPTVLRHKGHYGNALLTRLPLQDVQQVDLSLPGHEPRGALDVTLTGTWGELRVIATHLGLRPWERYQQVRRLLGRCPRNCDTPLVLMGDLNEWFVWGRPLRWIHEHFGETPALKTFPSRHPIFALDRIWVQPVHLLRCIRVHQSALARIASDHLPLYAELNLQGKQVPLRPRERDAASSTT